MEEQLQEQEGKGADRAVEREICYQRRKHQPRHETEGDEERNIQRGWTEWRAGIPGLPACQSAAGRDLGVKTE